MTTRFPIVAPAVLMAAVLAPVALWLNGCAQPVPDKAPAASAAALTVSTVPAVIESWPSIYEATGTVRARFSTVVSSKFTGYVREVKVQTGDRVRAGQLLVALDARDLDINVQRAESAREEIRNTIPEADGAISAAAANLDLANVTFARMRELFEKKSISHQEFDEAVARLKAAQAASSMAEARHAQLISKLALADRDVRAAEIAQAYAEITSPLSGFVTAKAVEPGNLAQPGAPLLTIESDGAYRLEAQVGESHLAAVRVGQPVSVALDGADSGRAIDAHVSEIVPSVDADSRSYVVKIDLPAVPSLRSGVFGRARFQVGKRSVLSLPAGAVAQHGQIESAFVVEPSSGSPGVGLARVRIVTTGQRQGDRAESLSGLVEGDRVVFPIPPGLADGSPVTIPASRPEGNQ